MRHFISNIHQICFSAGLCSDPLGELTALPRPPSWALRGQEREGRGEERREGKSKGGERGRGLRVCGRELLVLACLPSFENVLPPLFLDCASFWARPKLSMSFLTQSHQVFLAA